MTTIENGAKAPQIGDTMPASPPKKKGYEEVIMNNFVRDDFGALRCTGHRKTGYIPKSMKAKVVIFSELEAWRVTRLMTEKEKKNGTHNAKVPLGPVPCDSGFAHWHLGHSPVNVGRKPKLVFRIQLFVEKFEKTLHKIDVWKAERRMFKTRKKMAK